MYAHCIYCAATLRTNTDIEPCPVGRQLAFDEVKGRLWIVCLRCGRWNLTPWDTRWEAIESCARRFAESPVRVSTARVGLARLESGTELIRIGVPNRHEFAAWRYGRVLASRRRRAYATAASLGVGAVGALSLAQVNPAAYVALPLAAALAYAGSLLMLYRSTVGPIARVHGDDGRSTVVRGRSIASMRLIADASASDGWMLQVPTAGAPVHLIGGAARRVIARVLAHVNRGGGGNAMVHQAVRLLNARGTSGVFLRDYTRRHQGVVADPMQSRVQADWLALEMALHEESERMAFDGDGFELEAAWREAEELAQVADELLLPQAFSDRLARWRQRR